MSGVFPFDDDPLALVARLRSLAEALEGLTLFRPSSSDRRSAPLLRDWEVWGRMTPCLKGRVYGHPALGECTVATSELFAMDSDGRWARTASRYYRLGEPRRQRAAR